MKLIGLNRVEVLVHDPDQAQADFSALFGGLEFKSEPAGPENPLDCRVDWKAGIEIVHPESEEHAVGQLLKQGGEHVFTVVFEVESLDDARDWVTSQGFGILYEFDNGTDESATTIRQLTVETARTHGMTVTFLERVSPS